MLFRSKPWAEIRWSVMRDSGVDAMSWSKRHMVGSSCISSQSLHPPWSSGDPASSMSSLSRLEKKRKADMSQTSVHDGVKGRRLVSNELLFRHGLEFSFQAIDRE